MQSSSRYALIVIVVCMIGIGLYYKTAAPQLSPQQQILRQIVTALNGANSGQEDTVLSVIAPDYLDSSGHDKDYVRAGLARVFSYAHHPHYTVTQPLITVTGDTATTDFTVQVTDPATNYIYLTRAVHVVWRRERTHVWLVIPTTIWLATSSDANFDLYELGQ